MATAPNFKSVRFFTVLGLMALLISCAKEDSSPRGKLNRGDTTPDAPAAQSSPDSSEPVAAPSPTVAAEQAKAEAQIFTKGEKSFKLEAFKIPEIIIERQIRRGEKPSLPSTAYQMHDADLVIDLERDEMRLKVDIEANGVREKVELKGSFNKLSQIWEGQLLATDETILKERRIQAVVLCIKPYMCDQVWMDLYYYVNGKPERRQFVSGAEPAMVPISENLSIPLPKADANGMVDLPEEFLNGLKEEEALQEESESAAATVQPATPQAPVTPKTYPLDPNLKRAVEEQAKKKAAQMPPLPRKRPDRPAAKTPETSAPAKPATAPPEMFNHNIPQDEALKKKLEEYIANKGNANKPAAQMPPLPRKRPDRPAAKTPETSAPAKPATAPPEMFNHNIPQDEALKKKLEEYVANQSKPATTPVAPAVVEEAPAPPKVIPFPRPLSERPPEPKPAPAPVVSSKTVQVHQDDIPIEYTTEMQLPLPSQSQFSIQGAEDLKIDIGDDKRWGIQAKGSHTNGSLQNGIKIDEKGCGYKRRNASGQIWGTGLLLEMITEAACIAENEIKRGFPLLIGSISLRYGGDGGDRRKFGHSSHRNGLDVDLGIYHKNQNISQFWNPLQSNFASNFDYEKNWSFLKALHSTSEKRVMIVFLDKGIKSKMCKWVKEKEGLPSDPSSPEYRALRHLSHWAGHANHYHVRLYCPSTTGCVNKQADPRASGTGC